MGLWTPERAREVQELKEKRNAFLATMAYAKQVSMVRSIMVTAPKPKQPIRQWRWTTLPNGMCRLDEAGK